MSDKNTKEMLRTSMRQIVEMAPPPPELPITTERQPRVRPTVVLVLTFVAVMLTVGVVGLLPSTDTEPLEGDIANDGTASRPVATTITETPASDQPAEDDAPPEETTAQVETTQPETIPQPNADGSYTLWFDYGNNNGSESKVLSPDGPPRQVIVEVDGNRHTADIDWSDPAVGKVSLEAGNEIIIIDVLP